MDKFSELSVFVRISDELNLTRAANTLGMSVSSVSRHLGSLEDRLGVRLVQRTTRHLSLTPDGERFCEEARDILVSLRAAEEGVSLAASEARGMLRVGASLSFSLLHLTPVVEAFCARHPQVDVELQISNRYSNLIEGDLDLAIRTRRVEEDSSVTIRKLAQMPRFVAASPRYLATRGVPERPEDLKHHDLLLYTLADDWQALTFHRHDQVERIAHKARIASNDGQVLRRAALGDLGILVQPAYILEDDLRAGRLVRVLTDWELPLLTMNIAFPTRQNLPAKIRLFINSIYDYFEENGLEARWRLL